MSLRCWTLLSFPQIIHEFIIVVVLLVRGETFARILLPLAFGIGGEEGIRLWACVDQGEAKFIGQRHHHLVDLSATHHENLLLFEGRITLQFGEVADDFAAWRVLRLHGAGEDDVAAVGQRPADGEVGVAAHQDSVSCGEALEVFHIGIEVPNQLIVSAYRKILRYGGDDCIFHKRFLWRPHFGSPICREFTIYF